MKTPWIHHERMQQIRSKQMNIFKSSRVQKNLYAPIFSIEKKMMIVTNQILCQIALIQQKQMIHMKITG